jgi:putative transposase
VDQHGERAGHSGHLPAGRHGCDQVLRKLLKGLEYVPRVLVTDKLASYRTARRRVLRSVEHRRPKYLNNRAKNSHQLTRARNER